MEFKEINRIPISDSTEIVISEMNKNGKLYGYAVNKYITSEKYTGFAKGITIPLDKLQDFLKSFPANPKNE